MSILSLFSRRNPARELALIGIEKRKADVKATARRIREELRLPPLEALQ